jgi:hypothetical protein
MPLLKNISGVALWLGIGATLPIDKSLTLDLF